MDRSCGEAGRRRGHAAGGAVECWVHDRVRLRRVGRRETRVGHPSHLLGWASESLVGVGRRETRVSGRRGARGGGRWASGGGRVLPVAAGDWQHPVARPGGRYGSSWPQLVLVL